MIRGYVLGFNRPDRETRYGDAELIRSYRGKYNLLIDGYCGSAADKLVLYLKKRKIKDIYLALTHAHYDHYDGLFKIMKDNYFNVKKFYCYNPDSLRKGLRNNEGSNEVLKDIHALEAIISYAKNKGITVIFVDHNDTIKIGDIKINVYRQQPVRVEDNDDNGYSYINDGSLCFYFPELYYWTSGDGSEMIWNFIKSLGLNVKYFKIPHHGNNCTESQAKGLKSHGCDICWYNDLEPKGIGTEDFTAFGARRCLQAGIKVLDCIGDINWTACNGTMTIYHKGKNVGSYGCKYMGLNELVSPTANIIRNIFMNKYGKGDDRVTNLLDNGYHYGNAQVMVNKVVEVAQNIIDGKLDFGKNEIRILNLDKRYGTGYGQLIQDEINSLLKSKNAKW